MVWGKVGRGKGADEVKLGGRWKGGLGAGEVQDGEGKFLREREFWEDGPAGSMGRLNEEECFHQTAAVSLL